MDAGEQQGQWTVEKSKAYLFSMVGSCTPLSRADYEALLGDALLNRAFLRLLEEKMCFNFSLKRQQ